MLQQLHENNVSCTLCPRHKTCISPIIGQTTSKPIVFVGDWPTYVDNITEENFQGRPGQLFDKILREVGLSRSQVYITNIVKCYSKTVPKKTEVDTCRRWLYKEFDIIKPQVVFTLGKLPASRLLHLKCKDKLADVVGKIVEVPYMSKFKLCPLFSLTTLMNRSDWELTKHIGYIKTAIDGITQPN